MEWAINQPQQHLHACSYLKLETARSKVLSENGRNSSSATSLYVGMPGADALVI